MARGRKKSTTTKKINKVVAAPEPVAEEVSTPAQSTSEDSIPVVSSVYIGQIEPKVEPVPEDIQIEKIEPVTDEIPQVEPEAELPEVEEVVVPKEILTPPEPVNVIKGLPDPIKSTGGLKPNKPDRSSDQSNSQEVTSNVTIEKVEDKKSEPEDKVPLYPKNVSPIIEKLKRQPAYRYLPYETLVKIAAAKLRSRYFYNTMKTGAVKANFNIK